MTAELTARRTAAAAALADFRREMDKYIDSNGAVPRPDMSTWAWRLSSELGSVLQRLEAEDAEAAPVPAAPRDRRACLASSCPPPKLADCQWPKCAPPAADPAAAQLAKVRQVLDAFNWETDDRQYALEHIDDIVNGRPR